MNNDELWMIDCLIDECESDLFRQHEIVENLQIEIDALNKKLQNAEEAALNLEKKNHILKSIQNKL